MQIRFCTNVIFPIDFPRTLKCRPVAICPQGVAAYCLTITSASLAAGGNVYF